MSRLRSILASLVAIAAVVALVGVSSAPANAASPPGATISGTVTSAGGGPLTQPVLVSARQGSYNANWIAYADADTGEYTIDGLPAGNYLIVFMPVVTDVFAPQYREQLYDGVYLESAATRIEVTADGQSFEGVDAVMEYEPTEEPGNPVAALPCIDPRDQGARRALVRQFIALGGSLKALTRADVVGYLARCA